MSGEAGRCTENTDVFSLGVNLYEMCFLEYPWPIQPNVTMTLRKQKEILKGKSLRFNGKKRKISKKLGNLLNDMLKFEDDERMTFEELYSHEFFKKELKTDLQKVKTSFEREKELLEIEKKKNQFILNNPNEKQKGIAESDKPLWKKEDIPKIEPLSHVDVDKIDQKFCIFLESIRNPNKNISLKEEVDILQSIHDMREKQLEKHDLDLEGSNKTTTKIELKKLRNKIIFLEYLDKKIENFNCTDLEISITNKNPIRLMVQKIKISLIFNNLRKIENNGKKMEDPSQYKKFMKILGDSMKKFSKMQEIVFKEIHDEKNDIHRIVFLGIPCFCTYEKNRSIYYKKGVNWFLEFLNPQIKENEFLDLFANLLDPIMKPMEKFIRTRNNVVLYENQEEFRKIVNMHKNFLVLLNIEEVFNNMNDDDAKEFCEETITECEESEFSFGQLLNKLT